MCYFCSLHVHNQYSTLDGFGGSDRQVKVVKDYGQNALALTNHGNTCGLFDHYNACKAENIKPILGTEAYFEETFEKEKWQEEKKRGGFCHLTILAQNNIGYANLNSLVTESNKEENFYYKPITTYDNLKRHREGLIVLSGCILSRFARLVKQDRYEDAEILLLSFRDTFQENFFLEVMPPFISGDSDEDIEFHKHSVNYNNWIIAMGKKHNIPVVMTTDAHFAAKEDWKAYKTMRFMSQNVMPDGHYKYRHLMDAKTANHFWKKYMGFDGCEYLENTGLIVDKVNVEFDTSNKVPTVDWGIKTSSIEHLARKTLAGLKRIGKFEDDVYRDRINYELDTIQTKGFADYFLIVEMICSKANELGVRRGFGRGSVCGSLLAYCLGITAIDPIKFDISFDRFLRPDKTTMPDVDLDFDSRGQLDIMNFLLEYFPGKASRISTFGEYSTKNLFNDMIKFYDIDKNAAFLVGVKNNLEREMEIHGPDFEKFMENKVLERFNEDYPNFFEIYTKIYGQIKYIGKHPAGVAISDKNFNNYDSIMRIGGEYVSAHNMLQIESMGLIKMDILGVTNVGVISDIEKMTGVKFDYSMLEDPKVYKAFCNDLVVGIFQFDSFSSKSTVKQVKPKNIQELMACNSLNRPGPLKKFDDTGLSTLDLYAKGKAGDVDKTTFWYPYTKDTYGCVIYQDQILKICREVAGLSWADSDQIMKGLSKKNEGKRIKLRQIFIDGCVKNGIPKSQAEEFYDKNTLYGFPKAHAAGYTVISAYCMWLKINYPVQFWLASLQNETNSDKVKDLTVSAAKSDVLIFPAHVNGGDSYRLIKDNNCFNIKGANYLEDGQFGIQEGLSAIKGIGKATCKFLETNGPFKNREEFDEIVSKNKRGCNSASVKRLEEAGALEFDSEKYLENTVKYNSELRRSRKWGK